MQAFSAGGHAASREHWLVMNYRVAPVPRLGLLPSGSEHDGFDRADQSEPRAGVQSIEELAADGPPTYTPANNAGAHTKLQCLIPAFDPLCWSSVGGVVVVFAQSGSQIRTARRGQSDWTILEIVPQHVLSGGSMNTKSAF